MINQTMNRSTLIGFAARDAMIDAQGGVDLIIGTYSLTPPKQTKAAPVHATWHRIVVRGKERIEVARRIRRGDRVLITGPYTKRAYKNTGGEMRTAFELWADQVQLLQTADLVVENALEDGTAEFTTHPEGYS